MRDAAINARPPQPAIRGLPRAHGVGQNPVTAMKTTLSCSLMVATLALFAEASTAADWPNWRGPANNGSTTETGLPTTFSKTENVKWAAAMPGPAASTPVVWQDRVFVSSIDTSTKSLIALCLKRSDGSELWRKEIGLGVSRDNRSNFASPSPVTDGTRVIFFYGNGDLVSFDLNGGEQWRRSITKDYGEFAFQWTFSTSPVLYDGKLYLQVLQRDVPVNGRGRTDGPNESYLLALAPDTGKELWRHIRPADARAESLEAFTTPVPFEYQGRKELLIAGGDCITGHDPQTGKELWRWGTWNPNRITHWRLVPSPVGAGPVVLACAPKGDPVYAVKAGLSGTLTNSDLAWISQAREVSTDVATPLYYEGSIYLLNTDRKMLHRIEPATGKVLWSGELPSRSKLETSPLGADGRIYMMNHDGIVFVAKAGGDQFELLHQTDLSDEGDRELRSSIIAAHGHLFVRTGQKLYCFGK